MLSRMIYFPGVELGLGVVSRSPERCSLVFHPPGLPVPVLIQDKILLSFLGSAIPSFCGSSLSFSPPACAPNNPFYIPLHIS